MPEVWDSPPPHLSAHYASEPLQRLDLSSFNRQQRHRAKESMARLGCRTLGDVASVWSNFPPHVQRLLHESAQLLSAVPAPAAAPATGPAPAPEEAGFTPIELILRLAPELLDQPPAIALRRLAPEYTQVARKLTLLSALEHVDPLRSNAASIATRIVAARHRASAIALGPCPHPQLSSLWEKLGQEIGLGLLAGPLPMEIAFDAQRLLVALEADGRRWLTVSLDAATIEAEPEIDLATRTALLVGLAAALAENEPNTLLEAIEGSSKVSRTTRELTELLRRCEPLLPRVEHLLAWQVDFETPDLKPMQRRNGTLLPIALDQVEALRLSTRERRVVRLLTMGGTPALVEAIATLAGFNRLVDAKGESVSLVCAPLKFRVLTDARRGVSIRAVANGRLVGKDRLWEALTTRSTMDHILLGFGPVQVVEVNPACIAAIHWWYEHSQRAHPLEAEKEIVETFERLHPWVPLEGQEADAEAFGDAEPTQPEVELPPLDANRVDFQLWRQHYLVDCKQRLSDNEISSSTYRIYVRTMDRLLEILANDYPDAQDKDSIDAALDHWLDRARAGEVGMKSDPNNVPQAKRRAVGLLTAASA